MEFRTLHYFLTVAQERNITRAAEKLHMAQPPLTRQIKRIDGVELRHCERRIRKTEVIRGKTSEMLCLGAAHRGVAELGRALQCHIEPVMLGE